MGSFFARTIFSLSQPLLPHMDSLFSFLSLSPASFLPTLSAHGLAHLTTVPFLLLLILFLLLLLIIVDRWDPSSPHPGPPLSSSSSSSSSSSNGDGDGDGDGDGSGGGAPGSPLIQMLRTFRSYDECLKLQLNKTLDPRLRRLWATRDWDGKINAFAHFFAYHVALDLLSNTSPALCVDTHLGQEVAMLRHIGIAAALGIDLAPMPLLLAECDFHAQPFADASFDFEFSNIFDHALYPDLFAAEIQRTLRPGGVVVLHVVMHRRGDKYSDNDILGLDGVVALFNRSHLLCISKIDAFSLDTELILRKKINLLH